MKKESIYFKVFNGALIPASDYYSKRLEDKKYKQGDLIRANLFKPRKSGTNKNAHKIGYYMTEHHDFFMNMNAHTALKYLQIESGVACDIYGQGNEAIKIPKSMSFEDMDEGEFQEAVRGICRHISDKYWPDLTPYQIELQAERMVIE